MTDYRPATKDDVGRTDVEVNDAENHEWIGPRKLFAVEPTAFPFLAGDERGLIKCNWNLARVPILPEESALHYVKTTPPTNRTIEVKYMDDHKAAPLVTIRRKLEAGGLAEAEQAILLDGRYYPVDWVKSSPGVLPEQVEIV